MSKGLGRTMIKSGDFREEYLPNWEPGMESKEPALNGHSNGALFKDVPLDCHLPGGIGDDFHRVEVYKAADKLKGRAALITGGARGIGRSIALLYAMEGAAVALTYLPSEENYALRTRDEVSALGAKCVLIPKDLRSADACKEIIETAIEELCHLEILVNNAGIQMPCTSFEDCSIDQIENTFKVNILALMYVTKYALPYLKRGASIINCASVQSFRGQPDLCDYCATKGAIIGFTRALGKQKAEAGIRVNAVAPGPIHTPIQKAFEGTRTEPMYSTFPLQRVGQPVEVATAFVFLASNDSSFFTSQVLHPNGGYAV